MSDEGAPDPAPGTVERRSPEEAFALLGNETRMNILRALGETPNEPVGFSALRERAGVRDSGQFNYHLGRLTGHFVRKTDGGYVLTVAGQRLVGALLAGTYTATAALAPVEVDADCPVCGGSPLVAEYADEHVTMRCTDCEAWRNRFTFPPGTVDQFDREELPAAFDRWLRSTFGRIVAGFCGNCAGRLAGRLVRVEDWPTPVRVVYSCEQCGDESSASVSLPLLYHPAGVGFFYDHGVDVTTTPSWRLLDRDSLSVEVASEEPLTARVAVTLDGERLVATVREDATLTDVSREQV